MNVATGYSPFFLLYSQNPEVPSSLFTSYRQATNIESNETMLKRMHTALSDASASYKHAQAQMINTVNNRWRDVQFKVGDEVVIKTSFLPQQTFAQILPKI